MRLCLSLGVTPVFAPVREHGFQNALRGSLRPRRRLATCTLLDRPHFPHPHETLDSALISVQENWGRFVPLKRVARSGSNKPPDETRLTFATPACF